MIGRKLSHYLIERRLGAGGMGEVYLAQDLALGRAAALKLLRSDVAGELGPRLAREAETFARLQHPWIATFFEAGADGDTPFLAMEYVPGSTLRARLREGPLELDQALALASCLLEALAHAHAAGVLHRDIKPENIMVVGEGPAAKLLDFGIAASRAVGTEHGADLTRTNLTQGHVVGTAGYMAPEQLRGVPTDARTDLFAAGAVLYESIAGSPAFPGDTPTERIAAILTGEPAPLRGPGVTPALEEVIGKALARDPGDRFPTAAAFLSELRRLRSGASASQLPDSIAVLDLENLSRNPEDDWITSGIAESLSSDLARIPGLHVVAREKVLQTRAGLGSAAGDALALGHRLGSRWVLSGGIQRMGPALRITARLTEVPTGLVIAAEKVDGNVEDVFEMQDRLASAIVARLDRAAIARAPVATGAANVQAFELYSKGKRFTDRLEKGTFEQAQELFEEAIRIEPRHAPALCGLAMLHALRFTFTTDPAVLDEAERYARRSIEADPGFGDPHVWLCYVVLRRRDPEAAFAEAQQAVELDSTNVYAHYFSGCAKALMGRHEEAVPHLQKALYLDPHHAFSWLGLGAVHTDLGNHDEAIWCLRKTVELEGTEGRGPTAGAAGFLGEALRRAGDLEGARRAALQGLASAEKTDHMYRDTFRGISLLSLGRTALDQGDPAAAHAAFQQALLHVRGRPRALGGGFLVVQALAGLARCGEGEPALREAISIHRTREGFDFSWTWSLHEDVTHLEVARAARALGDMDLARAHLAAARRAGSLEARKEEW